MLFLFIFVFTKYLKRVISTFSIKYDSKYAATHILSLKRRFPDFNQIKVSYYPFSAQAKIAVTIKSVVISTIYISDKCVRCPVYNAVKKKSHYNFNKFWELLYDTSHFTFNYFQLSSTKKRKKRWMSFHCIRVHTFSLIKFYNQKWENQI